MVVQRNSLNLPIAIGFAVALTLLPQLQSCRSGPLPAEHATPPADVQAQIAHGGKVYAAHCAECHGKSGQGKGRAPALIGKQAFGEFDDALEVALFVTKNMPPKPHQRSALTEVDYWAVLAFALSANGVSLAEPVNKTNAAAIKLGG